MTYGTEVERGVGEGRGTRVKGRIIGGEWYVDGWIYGGTKGETLGQNGETKGPVG